MKIYEASIPFSGLLHARATGLRDYIVRRKHGDLEF